jgi:hypothetical protein
MLFELVFLQYAMKAPVARGLVVWLTLCLVLSLSLVVL